GLPIHVVSRWETLGGQLRDLLGRRATTNAKSPADAARLSGRTRMAPAGLEPATSRLGIARSILMSYEAALCRRTINKARPYIDFRQRDGGLHYRSRDSRDPLR